MPYTKFQLIALETPTLFATNPLPAADAAHLDKIENLVLDDLDQDARDRLEWLLDALWQAMEHKEVYAKDGTILKIFIAPEFFFRPQEIVRTVEEEREDIKTGIVTKLKIEERFYKFKVAERIEGLFKEIFCQATYKDWLIVPGTLVRGDAVNNKVTPNQLIAILGGQEQDQVIQIKHNKVNTSSIDGIADESKKKIIPMLKKGGKSGKVGGSTKDVLVGQLHNVQAGISNTFMVESNQIGVEICLDHAYGVLRHTCRLGYDTRQAKDGVDLQLLVACGIKELLPIGIAAGVDGYILHIDGNPEVVSHSDVTTVTQFDVTEYDLIDFKTLKAGDSVKESVLRKYQPDPNKKYEEYLRIYNPLPLPK